MHCANVYVKPVLLASVAITNFSFKLENARVGSYSYFPFNIWNASSQPSLDKFLTLLNNFVNSKSFRNQREHVKQMKDLICFAVVGLQYVLIVASFSFFCFYPIDSTKLLENFEYRLPKQYLLALMSK